MQGILGLKLVHRAVLGHGVAIKTQEAFAWCWEELSELSKVC